MAEKDQTGLRRAPSGAVEVTPEVVGWALRESGMRASELAGRIGVSEQEIRSWVAGDASPSRGQFTKLAKELARPEAIFFLPSAPAESSIPPQFRVSGTLGGRALDPEAMLRIRRAQRLQDLLRWVLVDEGHRSELLSALPHASAGEGEAEIAGALRKWLDVSVEKQLAYRDGRAAFQLWRSAIERNGVFVMQHHMGRDGVRGFSLADERAPLIVVNRSETPQARSFTLMHELAHLASKPGSACVAPRDYRNDRDQEQWCDRVASHVLIPRDALEADVRQRRTQGNSEPFSLVSAIATWYKVSLRAATVALTQSGHVPRDTYAAVARRAPANDFPEAPSGSDRHVPGGGERAAAKRLRELGAPAIEVLNRASQKDRITLHDVLDHLDVNVDEYDELLSELKRTEQSLA